MPRTTLASGALHALLIAPFVALGQQAVAQLPDAAAFLAEEGFSQDQIAQVQAGEFVTASIQPSNEREIVAAFAFLVPNVSPTDLVNQLGTGFVDKMDANTIAFEMISGAPTPASFAKLELQPGEQARVQAYLNAEPGSDLNLSSEEIAAFDQLGSGASTAAVEQTLRTLLLARLQAYQAKGLAGAAPYARGDGKTRSPGEELRSATQASKRLQKLAPNAHQLFLNYPASKPAGLREAYRWEHYQAHGAPTIALMHSMYVPEGDAWAIVQRQFYVSNGYNAEQAVVGFFPTQKGTLVFYTNRTSTDQVEGFGGGAKRAIGSKLLQSELEALYKKVRAAE
jgi:hypothetical protein